MSARAPAVAASHEDRVVVWSVLAVICILVLAATLTPASEWDNSKKRVFCVACDRGWAADVVGNALLLLPLGFCLSLASVRGNRTVVAAAAFSISIEAAQSLIPGRSPNLGDVLFNVTGAWFGWMLPRRTAAGKAVAHALLRTVRHLVFPSQRLEPWISLSAAASVAAVLVVTRLLLTPDFPAGPYFAGAGSLDSNSGPLYLGGNTRARDFLHGSIDEVRIFARPRNAADIREDMNRTVSRDGERVGPEAGLVAAYDFEGDIANGLTDVSGRGHNGLVSKATQVQGRFGRGLKFSGRPEDVVTIPHSTELDLASGMTIEAWVNPSAPQNDWGNIVQKDADAYFLTAGSDAGPLRPAGGGSFGELLDNTRSPQPIPLNTWSHLAVTYDGATIALYVNGEPAITRQRWSPARLRDASLGAIAIEGGKVGRSGQLRTQLMQGAPLRIRFDSLPLPDTLVPVVAIRDQQQREVLFVGTQSADIVVRSRMVASRGAFNAPAFRLRGVLLGHDADQPLTFTISRDRASYCVQVDARARCGVGLGIAAGWAFLVDSTMAPPWVDDLFNILWLGLLFFGAGLCVYRRRAIYAAVILVAWALLVLPPITGLPSTTPMQAIASVAALFSGYGCRVVLQGAGRRA